MIFDATVNEKLEGIVTEHMNIDYIEFLHRTGLDSLMAKWNNLPDRIEDIDYRNLFCTFTFLNLEDGYKLAISPLKNNPYGVTVTVTEATLSDYAYQLSNVESMFLPLLDFTTDEMTIVVEILEQCVRALCVELNLGYMQI